MCRIVHKNVVLKYETKSHFHQHLLFACYLEYVTYCYANSANGHILYDDMSCRKNSTSEFISFRSKARVAVQ